MGELAFRAYLELKVADLGRWVEWLSLFPPPRPKSRGCLRGEAYSDKVLRTKY